MQVTNAVSEPRKYFLTEPMDLHVSEMLRCHVPDACSSADRLCFPGISGLTWGFKRSKHACVGSTGSGPLTMKPFWGALWGQMLTRGV